MQNLYVLTTASDDRADEMLEYSYWGWRLNIEKIK